MGGRKEFFAGIIRPNRLRFPLALGLGVIIWLFSLPPFGIVVFSILAFVPVLVALPGEGPRRIAAWGWLGGSLWEFATIWWLIPTVVNYGGISLPAAVALIAGMSIVLGLYYTGFLVIVSVLVKKWGNWALILAAPSWVLWEWLRGVLLTGFPWWGPGYGLSQNNGLLQLSRLGGILGLSLLAVFVASAISLWMVDRRNSINKICIPVALVLLVSSFLWGHWQYGRPLSPGPTMLAAYIQPNVPQDEKWSAGYAEKIMERFENLTGRFERYKVRMAVWPESSTPFVWNMNNVYRERVVAIASKIDAPILLGSVVSDADGDRNAALLVMPDGSVAGEYAKTHLVPFGEYVPLKGMLGFAKPLVEAVGELKPGKKQAPMQSPVGRIGITVCYEGIFPTLVRSQVKAGAQVLVNMTNDAWYRGTPGPLQHYLIERVRAVENDRYMIRSANLGISTVVTPRGAMESTAAIGVPDSNVGLVEARDTRTLWNVIGNLWLYIPLILLGLALLFPRKPDLVVGE